MEERDFETFEAEHDEAFLYTGHAKGGETFSVDGFLNRI